MKPYIVALLLVVGILGGFYGGYRVGNHNNTVSASTNGGLASRTPGGGGFTGGRGGGASLTAACPSPGAPSPSPGTSAAARGTVTDLTASSLTISQASCDVKISFGNTVQVSKTVPGSTSDLMDNTIITVIGTRQADGSIKATTIQIGGTGTGFGNPGGGQQSPAGG